MNRFLDLVADVDDEEDDDEDEEDEDVRGKLRITCCKINYLTPIEMDFWRKLDKKGMIWAT